MASPDFFLHWLCASASTWLTAPRLDALRIDQQEIADVIGERVARAEFVYVTPRPLDGDFAFQVALHADFIAPGGR